MGHSSIGKFDSTITPTVLFNLASFLPVAGAEVVIYLRCPNLEPYDYRGEWVRLRPRQVYSIVCYIKDFC